MSFFRGLGSAFRAASEGRNTAKAHRLAEQMMGTSLPADVAQDAYNFASRMAEYSSVEQMSMIYVSTYAERMVPYLDAVNATEGFRLQVARNVARACTHLSDLKSSGTDFSSFGLDRLIVAAKKLGVDTDSPSTPISNDRLRSSNVDVPNESLGVYPLADDISRNSTECYPDFFEMAGEELLSGKVKPSSWARALIDAGGDESLLQPAYVRFRVEELKALFEAEQAELKAEQEVKDEARFVQDREALLCHEAIAAYDASHLEHLQEALERDDEEKMTAIRDSIYRQSGRVPPQGNPSDFLRAVHRRLSEKLRSELD